MQQNYKVGIGLCNYYIITNCGQSLYTYCIIHVAGKDDKSEVVTTKEIGNKGKEDHRWPRHEVQWQYDVVENKA